MVDPLRSLEPEARVLCLAARTTISDPARARLGRIVAHGVDWEQLWALAHLHEVVPLVGASIAGIGGDAVPGLVPERAVRRRHVTLRTNAHLRTP